jgi:hypothetical protein
VQEQRSGKQAPAQRRALDSTSLPSFWTDDPEGRAAFFAGAEATLPAVPPAAHPAAMAAALAVAVEMKTLDRKEPGCKLKRSPRPGWMDTAIDELRKAHTNLSARHACYGVNRWLITRYAVLEAWELRVGARMGLSRWRLGLRTEGQQRAALPASAQPAAQPAAQQSAQKVAQKVTQPAAQPAPEPVAHPSAHPAVHPAGQASARPTSWQTAAAAVGKPLCGFMMFASEFRKGLTGWARHDWLFR